MYLYTDEIDWTSSEVISTTIVERFEEIECVLNDEDEDLTSEERQTLQTEFEFLKGILKQGETIDGWSRGVTLINSDVIDDHVKDIIDGILQESDINLSSWPFSNLRMDYETATTEYLSDYSVIEIDNETFYIRP